MNKSLSRGAWLVFAVLELALAMGFSIPQRAARAQVDNWQLTEELDPQFAVDWIQTTYDAVRAETINPPNSARIYGYAGVTLYEALYPGMPFNRSFVGQLNGLRDLPYPDEALMYDWEVVASEAMRVVLEALFRTASEETLATFTDMRDRSIAARIDEMGEDVINNSLEYGEELGKGIVNWIEEDNYLETREMNPEYEIPTGDPSFWQLTTPGTNPIEPYWGTMRPFILSYAEECNIEPNFEFSTEEDSVFYQQANEVYETGNDLTQEQRDIAEWWVDTPGITGAPAGHWMLIASQMVDLLELDLVRTAEMYAMVGIGVADAFISCWSLKYQVNLLRPVTYIQEYISRRWTPYIESPPFPEYPSGHSVVSGAAADVLTDLFGQVVFTDTANTYRGLTPRQFYSFEQAALEAATSRIYGGIHFRPAVENGVRQGRCVADVIRNNIILNPVRQGE